jgi:hypothetical protein
MEIIEGNIKIQDIGADGIRSIDVEDGRVLHVVLNTDHEAGDAIGGYWNRVEAERFRDALNAAIERMQP